MHEVYFLKEFIVKDGSGNMGPSEETIYWGSEEECKRLVDCLNNTLVDFIQEEIPQGPFPPSLSAPKVWRKIQEKYNQNKSK